MAPPRRSPEFLLDNRVQVALSEIELSRLDSRRSKTGQTRSAYLAAPVREPYDLRGLTVQQPWASLIALGLKMIENRPRDPGIRPGGQWVAIHAGLTWHVQAERARELAPDIDISDLPRGAIVGIAWVYPGVPLGQVFSTWATGPVCLPVRDAILLRPILCRGALGLWRVSPEIRAAIEEQTGPM